MERMYTQIIQQHFAEFQQMLFLAGPRQVGKSTICLTTKRFTDRFAYLNWDNENHRKILLQGEEAILDKLNLQQVSNAKPILILDEIHKYKHWKNFLKGFYDLYKGKINIIACGSAKLDVYKKGGDSLMGRYLLYRVHPLSFREIIQHDITERDLAKIITTPSHNTKQEVLQNLFAFGGYPEPYLKANNRFCNQWKRLRTQQLLKEDITDLKQVEDLQQLEILVQILREQAGGATNYSNLANAIRVSVDTIKRWLNILESFYYCFKVTPWHKNVKRSLLKEPRHYLWDWTLVPDKGAAIENFVACHLLKAIHFWTDHGLGEFSLHYLRDKDKREVDFLVCKNNNPWFLVEVKSSHTSPLNKNLAYFQQQTKAEHAFQVVFDLEHVAQNCFSYHDPIKVPLSTFLSQLV